MVGEKDEGRRGNSLLRAYDRGGGACITPLKTLLTNSSEYATLKLLRSNMAHTPTIRLDMTPKSCASTFLSKGRRVGKSDALKGSPIAVRTNRLNSQG